MSNNTVEVIQVEAEDGYSLSVSHYFPKGNEKQSKVIILSSATGVKKEYYKSYAEFLADHGFRVICFDYRGIGGSLVSDVKESKASMTEWGEKDLSGLLNWILKSFPEEKIFLIAHSIGGQIIGLSKNTEKISGAILVACSNAYWKDRGFFSRKILWLLWYFIFPVSVRVLHYLPAKMFGFGEDLPSGVASEWAKWGRDRDYLFSTHPNAKAKIEAMQVPILAYSFKDDRIAPALAVKRLLDIYPSVSKQWNHVSPKDLNIRSIGHMGFFKDKVKKTLWSDTLNWLKGF